jgi:hypothetical protein
MDAQRKAKAWMSDDSLRHRYEEMRNGVEQIRAEEQRQRNASRGGDARSKGKAWRRDAPRSKGKAKYF